MVPAQQGLDATDLVARQGDQGLIGQAELLALQRGVHIRLELVTIDRRVVDLGLEHRRKGLLWYSTYDVDFDAVYAFKNHLNQRAEGTVV